MAELVSPGVSISVTDESFYAAAGTGTVPLIVVATAQNKTAPDASGTATLTTADQAGKVKLITSQRELITQYGNPIFKNIGGTPLHGHELNEYGLQAAYSFLGAANRAYVLRANIDLAALEGSSTPPVSAPTAGTHWLDTAATQLGIKRWNGSQWLSQSVRVTPAAQYDSNNAKPKTAFGVDGEFAATYLDADGNTLATITVFEKVSGEWIQIGSTGYANDYQVAPHTALPTTQSGGGALQAGDIVLQRTPQNSGTLASIKVYDGAGQQFIGQPVTQQTLSADAYAALATAGGVSEGDIWVEFSSETATLTLKRHNGQDQLTAASTVALQDSFDSSVHTSGTVAIKISTNDRDVIEGDAGVINVSFYDYDSDADGNLSVDDMVTAIQDALSAADSSFTLSDTLSVANVSGKITVTSTLGADIKFQAGNVAGFTPSDLGLLDRYSNWQNLSYVANGTAPTGSVADGTLWYHSEVSSDSIDLLYNDNGVWATYPGNVVVTASEPASGTDGDVWVDSSDLENYPQLYRRSNNTWVQLDNADQETNDGVIFADFRAAANAPLDNDAPAVSLYPYGILAWNKRASGGNVKTWDSANQRWTDLSGNNADGSPLMLRRAQRSAVVRALQAIVSSNTDIRNETNRFNLIAVPGYPELLDEMIALNTDRKETAFIVADAPMRLSADATSIQNWATNSANAVENGEQGLVSSYAYSAIYYPHGLSTGLDGSNIVVPASHIALRTLSFNDQVAFPWFAPAGFQRGVVSNATSVGYIDASTGEYVPVSLSEGQRDALYINKINPIGQFPGRGLAVFGQKTLSAEASALDRVNVARLIVYIRERLDDIVKPFLFEPNDEVTRQNAKVVVDRFLGNLVTQRGLFDFVSVVDLTNNSPERIDRNELHIDVAVQPTKAVEFIFIPIRVQNTLGQTG